MYTWPFIDLKFYCDFFEFAITKNVVSEDNIMLLYEYTIISSLP